MSCGSGETCDNGTCVEESQDCSATCSGCCRGGDCFPGNADNACGANGDYCRDCQEGYTCNATVGGRGCDLDYNSRWDIIAVQATIPDRSSNGTFWDPGFSGQKADPYVKVTVDGLNQTVTEETNYEENTYSPYWSETTVSDVEAGDILYDTSYELWDYDPSYRGGDDLIVDNCTADFQESDFDRFATNVQVDCLNNPNANTPTDTTIWFQLEPH